MGLRTASSATAVTINSDAATIMAPALTEPVSHQSKISSPAQAASPRPIISDIEQLNRNNNSGQYLCAKSGVKNTRNESFVTATIGEQTLSNGPANGPLAVTHMDQTSSDNSAPTNDQQQQSQHQNTGDNLSSSASRTIDGQSDELESDRAIDQAVLCFAQQQQQQQMQLQPQPVEQQQQHQLQQPSTLPHPSTDAHEKEVPHELVRELAQAACSQSLDLLSETQSDVHHNIDEPATSSQALSTTSSNNNILGKDYLKETAEMEQMLGELASSSDIDLLQVFKSFESAPAGENLCDLAGGLSLFNDVDVMNMGLEDVVTNNSPVKECPTQEIIAEIEKKRAKMIRECDFMMRRLRKIQARQMGRHISEEMYGVYEYAQNLIKRKERETKSISTMAPINQLQSDKHKSTSSMKTMLKRIDNVASAQQTSPGRAINQPYGGSSSSSSSATATMSADSRDAGSSKHGFATATAVVPTFDANGQLQLEQCTGLLSTELKLVNDAFDSDATASSSGGESADEMVTYNNAIQQPLPM